jgi:hypothetical protein
VPHGTFTLAIALALLAGCGRSRPLSSDAPAGSVLLESVQGQVVRVERDNVVVLAAGDYVEPTQVVETSASQGAAALRLADGRNVLLGAGSRLRLASLATSTAGRDAVWAFLDAGSLRAGASYDVRRPVVVGTPRGPAALDGRAPIEVLSRSRR